MATITHNRVSGAASNPDVLVDGPAWDEAHVLTGQVELSKGGTNADLSATGGTGQVLKQVTAGAAVTVGTVAASEIASPAALTKTDDTNVTLTLGGAPTTALLAATSITVGWTGTLAAARLNTNVVQAITNDTNVTGSIAAQNLTLGWTGTLAAARGGFGADISAQSGVPLFATGTATFTGTSGTGNFVRVTSPTLTDPVVGTQSPGDNSTKAASTAYVEAAVSASGVTSIAGNTGAFTLANGIDNSTNQIQLTAARRTLPTTQTFTSGSGTYTTPANVLWIEVELVGGGGGGAGGGSSPGNGGAGGNTTFGTALLTGNGGSGANGATGGAGGSASGGHVNSTGSTGQNGSGVANTAGGNGGLSPLSRSGWGGAPGGGAGVAAAANSGSGGGGGGCFSTPNGGAGGGGGGYVLAIINSPSASYAYAVGAAGTAGTAGGGAGGAGAAGGSGVIIVTEHYGS